MQQTTKTSWEEWMCNCGWQRNFPSFAKSFYAPSNRIPVHCWSWKITYHPEAFAISTYNHLKGSCRLGQNGVQRTQNWALHRPMISNNEPKNSRPQKTTSQFQ